MNPIQPTGNLKQIPLVRAAAVVVGIVALALFAPIVWLAATGGIGLLLLGAVLATGLAVFQALPLLGQKLENRLLAARKAEARRNPIEQLQNDIVRRSERLRSFAKALAIVGGKIESIAQMVADHHQRDPRHVLEQQQRALQRLQQFHTINLARLGQARTALEDFRLTVKRKESEWTIAIAIGDANEMLDPEATDTLLQDLLSDTALRAVQDRFNTVFAELDVQMSSMDGPTRAMLDARSLDPMEALHLPAYQTSGSHS